MMTMINTLLSKWIHGLLINVFVALFVNVVHFSLFREAAGLISQRTQVNTAVTVHK